MEDEVVDLSKDEPGDEILEEDINALDRQINQVKPLLIMQSSGAARNKS